MADSMRIFDRRAVRAHRDRAAAGFAAHGFLFDEISERLVERRDDLGREFPVSLALGARGTVGMRFTTDLSAALRPDVVCDEEALPFGAETLDLVMSCLALHWVNDLPGALVQIRRALKPGGLFLAAMLGGDTLIELRHAFLEAEAASEGGASPRTSPMAELADASGLMQRAGFREPVSDLDTLTVTYPDALSLMRELRAMGESGAALARRRGFTRRTTMLAACERYAALYGDGEGRVPATFQVIFLTGWG